MNFKIAPILLITVITKCVWNFSMCVLSLKHSIVKSLYFRVMKIFLFFMVRLLIGYTVKVISFINFQILNVDFGLWWGWEKADTSHSPPPPMTMTILLSPGTSVSGGGSPGHRHFSRVTTRNSTMLPILTLSRIPWDTWSKIWERLLGAVHYFPTLLAHTPSVNLPQIVLETVLKLILN